MQSGAFINTVATNNAASGFVSPHWTASSDNYLTINYAIFYKFHYNNVYS